VDYVSADGAIGAHMTMLREREWRTSYRHEDGGLIRDGVLAGAARRICAITSVR
jgi:hypothetical protein